MKQVLLKVLVSIFFVFSTFDPCFDKTVKFAGTAPCKSLIFKSSLVPGGRSRWSKTPKTHAKFTHGIWTWWFQQGISHFSRSIFSFGCVSWLVCIFHWLLVGWRISEATELFRSYRVPRGIPTTHLCKRLIRILALKFRPHQPYPSKGMRSANVWSIFCLKFMDLFRHFSDSLFGKQIFVASQRIKAKQKDRSYTRQVGVVQVPFGWLDLVIGLPELWGLWWFLRKIYWTVMNLTSKASNWTFQTI